MPTPPSTGVTVLQVNLITPESGEVVDSDCFRLDHTTGAFSSNASSAQSMLNGFWYAYSPQQAQPALFTAHMTALATSSDGQPEC